MKSDKCPLCGDTFQTGKTTFTVELNDGLLIVREVPAIICRSCGNKWFENSIMIKLEEIAENARRRCTQIEVLKFDAA